MSIYIYSIRTVDITARNKKNWGHRVGMFLNIKTAKI